MPAVPRRTYLACSVPLGAFASLLGLLWIGSLFGLLAGLGCVAAVVYAVKIDRPLAQLAWYLIGGGALLLAMTPMLAAENAGIEARDILIVAGLASMGAGVGLLVAMRANERDWGSLIDTSAATAAAALVVWVGLLSSDIRSDSVPGSAKAAALLFCLVALALFATAVRLVLGLRVWTRAASLLCLSIASAIALASTAAAERLHGSSGGGWPIAVELVATCTLLAACALDPSMRRLSSTASERHHELTPSRLVLLAAAAVAAPTLLSVQAARDPDQLDLLATVLSSMIVTGLVIIRLAGLVLRQQRTTQRELLLRRAMRNLASADEHERVCQAIVEAGVALAGEQGGRVRASLILGSGRSAAEFASSGEPLVGSRKEISVPLTLREDRIGELVLASERELPEGILSALRSLASQAVLALESLQRTADLLEERRELESELLRRSHVDDLTSLPNRPYFLDRTEGALARMARNNEPVSVMIVNLDDFKTVNDTLGHVAGDELLRLVSDRLLACLRTDDTCARLGSDEWAVLIEESPPESPGAVAERIMTALERSFVLLGQHEVYARASIGSATVLPGSHDTEDAAELLRNAEVAMFHAKRHGRTGFEVFEPEMRAAVAERLALKAELERAVVASEFVIHYQPIVMLESGEICGLEALVRWNHPQRGLIPPFHFIPLAEETGLIVPLGRFVINEALRQGRIWQEMTEQPELVMSINLSGRQLDHGMLVEDVAEAIERAKIDPQTVILEITETALMEDVEAAIDRLNELKTLGIQMAIDDFGTGYSSLQYLRQFPADIIKVAKPFVDGVVEQGSDEYRIADAIVRLGETFGLRALAEGIEQPEQREMLRELGCELGQGFLFSKPLEPEAIEQLLQTPDAEAFV